MKPKQTKSVIGLFRRESQADSDSSAPPSTGGLTTPVVRDTRSGSVSAVYEIDNIGHSSQFPVTASHRRNTRKGSLLEISGWVSFLQFFYSPSLSYSLFLIGEILFLVWQKKIGIFGNSTFCFDCSDPHRIKKKLTVFL